MPGGSKKGGGLESSPVYKKQKFAEGMKSSPTKQMEIMGAMSQALNPGVGNTTAVGTNPVFSGLGAGSVRKTGGAGSTFRPSGMKLRSGKTPFKMKGSPYKKNKVVTKINKDGSITKTKDGKSSTYTPSKTETGKSTKYTNPQGRSFYASTK